MNGPRQINGQKKNRSPSEITLNISKLIRSRTFSSRFIVDSMTLYVRNQNQPAIPSADKTNSMNQKNFVGPLSQKVTIPRQPLDITASTDMYQPVRSASPL